MARAQGRPTDREGHRRAPEATSSVRPHQVRPMRNPVPRSSTPDSQWPRGIADRPSCREACPAHFGPNYRTRVKLATSASVSPCDQKSSRARSIARQDRSAQGGGAQDESSVSRSLEPTSDPPEVNCTLPRPLPTRHCGVISTELSICPTRCLVPRCGETIDDHGWREQLWARFYTGAPARLRRSPGSNPGQASDTAE